MTLRRTGVTAVHSVERIVFTVPDIEPAQKFYTAFGLDVKSLDSAVGPRVDLYTHGHPHCWMSVVANGQPKALQYISFGIFAEDEAAFKQKIESLGLGCAPHPMAETLEKSGGATNGSTGGLWLRDPRGPLRGSRGGGPRRRDREALRPGRSRSDRSDPRRAPR